MKVLISPAHYLFTDESSSGEMAYSYNLVKYIAQRVDQLDVFVGVSKLSKPLPANINLVSIYKSRDRHPAIELLKYLLFYPLICINFLFRRKKYDVLHHMLPTSPHTIDPLIFLIKVISPKTKVIIGPLQLHSQINTPQSFSIMLTGKSSESIFLPILSKTFDLIVSTTNFLSRATFNLSDAVVCNFYTIKNSYKNTQFFRKILVIPTGFDVSRVKNLQKKKKINKEIVIVCAGRLMEHKGHRYLLEAFRRLSLKKRNIKLVLMGDGNLRSEYQEFINKHSLQHKVILKGLVTNDQVLRQFSESDIHCLPSLIDTNPVEVQEAMSLGLPVVASNVGAVAEVVGPAGFVVSKASSQELYKALLRLVDNPKLRKKMGELAKERIMKYYDWPLIASEWVKLYKSRN